MYPEPSMQQLVSILIIFLGIFLNGNKRYNTSKNIIEIPKSVHVVKFRFEKNEMKEWFPMTSNKSGLDMDITNV
jgi:hypothetical protein